MPALRELVIYKQQQYCNARFIKDYMAFGWRFVWHSDLSSAVCWNAQTHMFTASPDFEHQLKSVRAYTLSRDFLDKYPELRGSAPQYEGSLTLHRPHETRTISDRSRLMNEDEGESGPSERTREDLRGIHVSKHRASYVVSSDTPQAIG